VIPLQDILATTAHALRLSCPRARHAVVVSDGRSRRQAAKLIEQLQRSYDSIQRIQTAVESPIPAPLDLFVE